MKIAMMTNNYKPFVGGVPISIERLTNSLRDGGHEVTIFAPTYENQVEEEGVVRYRSFQKTLANKAVVPYPIDREVEKKFKALDIDVIHVHHPNFVGWMALYLGRKYKVPVVYTYHTRYEQYLHHMPVINKINEISSDNEEGLRGKLATKMMKVLREKVIPKTVAQFANQCDCVMAPTTLMKDVLQDMGVVSPIEILPTGLNNSFFEKNEDKSEVIRSTYKGNKKYLFCSVARLNVEKNISFLIEGLKRLKEELGHNFNMLMIGDGPQKEVLKAKVKQLGLEGQIIFLNSVPNDEIKYYYGACDLFLFASKSETQGIVLLEAMASKLPVVAVKASGVVEVVKNGVNGYMTSEKVDEWVAAIMLILDNQEHFEQLKRGAYDTASIYTSESVAKRATLSYQSVVCKKKCEVHNTHLMLDKEGYSKESYYEKVYTR